MLATFVAPSDDGCGRAIDAETEVAVRLAARWREGYGLAELADLELLPLSRLEATLRQYCNTDLEAIKEERDDFKEDLVRLSEELQTVRDEARLGEETRTAMRKQADHYLGTLDQLQGLCRRAAGMALSQIGTPNHETAIALHTLINQIDDTAHKALCEEPCEPNKKKS